jgi:sigma-B regulation protein RsbU (phosphoserine phosphatase)
LKYAVTLTNDYIADTHGETGMFATIFFGLLDPADGTLTYINAGHEYPLVVTSNGECIHLRSTGPAVGVIPNVNFAVQEMKLQPGEIFFAFTDGAPDSLDLAENRFGRKRLVSLLDNHICAQTLMTEVYRQLTEYIGVAEQFDDITLLVVRRLPLSI